MHNPINPLEPILPTPKIQPISAISRAEGVMSIGANGKEGTPKKQVRVIPIPKSCFDYLKDADTMEGVLNVFGITATLCSLAGSASAKGVPFLNLLSAPTFLYQSANKAYLRFGLMVQAFKTGRIGDGFFWGAKGIDAGGDAIWSVSSSVSGMGHLIGFASFATFGLIFGHILPILMIVTGSMGGCALIVSLLRNHQEIKKLHETTKNSRLGMLVSILNYLEGPKENVAKEDRDADQAVRVRLQQPMQDEPVKSVNSHFSGQENLQNIQNRLEKIRQGLKKEKVTEDANPSWQVLLANYQELNDILKDLLEGNDLKILEKMDALYKNLLAHPHLSDEQKKLLSENQGKLRVQMSEKEQNVTQTKRAICSHAFLLFLFVLGTTGSLLRLTFPQGHLVATYLGLATSVLKLGHILTDKNLSNEDFQKLQRFLKI